jgi:hypothetical protein
LAGTYSPQYPQGLYLYPPFFAVAMTPFAVLFDDYRVANWAWAAVGAVALIASVLLVSRRESLAVGRPALPLVGAAFAFPPVIGELVMGNVHLVVLGLLGVAWWSVERSREVAASPATATWRTRRGDVLAGALVGLATLIKLFPAVVILWFVVTQRWTAAAASFCTLLALALLTLPVVGLDPWLDYPTVLLNLGAPVDTTDTVAPTVWVSAVLPPLVARLVVVGIGLAFVLWSIRRRSAPVSFAIAVAVSILVAPALYHHYLAVLVLPLVLALRWAPPVGWVAVAYLLMWGGEQEALGDVAWIVNRLLPTFGAVLLLVGLAWRGASSGLDDGPTHSAGR